MNPTSPLGYISGYPGAPTFSAGWTSNQAPNYPFPAWSGDPNAPGMTMAGNYGAASGMPSWWQAPPPGQRTNLQPQPPPQPDPGTAPDPGTQGSQINSLMGMIPNSGMLGLMGLLGGIPMSPQQMNNSGVAGLLSGKPTNPAAAISNYGMRMMGGGSPQFADPNGGILGAAGGQARPAMFGGLF